VLNLASNNLGEIVLAAGWRSKDDDDRAPWIGPEGQEQDEKPGKPEGIIAIAKAIPDMGALLVLSLKDTNLATKEAGEAIGEMLQANTVLKELDVSSNAKGYSWEDPSGFATGISKGLSGNGALIKLDISNNNTGAEQTGGLKRICVASGIDLAM
jgi:hypothetical protein